VNTVHDARAAFVPNQLERKQEALGGRLKRAFDIVVASLIVVVLAPFFVILAILIKMTEPGPIIYQHSRVGYQGKRFSCVKIRTMVVDSESRLRALLDADPAAREEWEVHRKLKDDPRITRLGSFLRNSSTDELPQLINVICGDMSLVGPRPVVSEELERYGEHSRLYLAARPGMTGPWQINGRSDASYESRVALDAHYVRNWRLSTDLLILIRTVMAVIRQRGSM
jgi:exopolysaccharide production protein ExoY